MAGLVESSIYEICLTLRNFERLFGALESRRVTQKVVDEFVLKRGREVGRSTVKKKSKTPQSGQKNFVCREAYLVLFPLPDASRF